MLTGSNSLTAAAKAAHSASSAGSRAYRREVAPGHASQTLACASNSPGIRNPDSPALTVEATGRRGRPRGVRGSKSPGVAIEPFNRGLIVA